MTSWSLRLLLSGATAPLSNERKINDVIITSRSYHVTIICFQFLSSFYCRITEVLFLRREDNDDCHHEDDDTLPIYQPCEKQSSLLDDDIPVVEKRPISDEVMKLPSKQPCPYDTVKTVLAITLLVNLTWQCAIRPLMINHNSKLGNVYFVDIGSSMLIGIQASYLPLYALLNARRIL